MMGKDYNDYTGLEFFIGEHLKHILISGSEGLIDEAVLAFDDELFDYIESTMEI